MEQSWDEKCTSENANEWQRDRETSARAKTRKTEADHVISAPDFVDAANKIPSLLPTTSGLTERKWLRVLCTPFVIMRARNKRPDALSSNALSSVNLLGGVI